MGSRGHSFAEIGHRQPSGIYFMPIALAISRTIKHRKALQDFYQVETYDSLNA
jgi:hypothetical protein